QRKKPCQPAFSATSASWATRLGSLNGPKGGRSMANCICFIPFCCFLFPQGSIPSGSVGSEELHQHRSKHGRFDLVGLAWQGAMLGMEDGVCQRRCGDVHKRKAGLPVHDECWDSHTGGFLGGDRGVFPHDGCIVSKR